jgi:hypothetical protein
MARRSEELRRRDRRVLMWSLTIAAALHVAVFLAAPKFRVEPLQGADVELDTTGHAGGGNASVRVFFGPPTVRVDRGSDWTAPPERVLWAERAVRLDQACLGLASTARTPIGGQVGLRIKASGRVDVLGMVDRSRDPCADRLLAEIAGDLWYHWLPNDRFQAPVNVDQPITIVTARLVGF